MSEDLPLCFGGPLDGGRLYPEWNTYPTRTEGHYVTRYDGRRLVATWVAKPDMRPYEGMQGRPPA